MTGPEGLMLLKECQATVLVKTDQISIYCKKDIHGQFDIKVEHGFNSDPLDSVDKLITQVMEDLLSKLLQDDDWKAY